MGITLMFRSIAASVAFIFILAAGSSVIAGNTAGHREVTTYTGRIVSHDDKTGEIVVKTAHSKRRWTLSRRVTAFYGKDRVQLPVVWHRSREVRLHVSDEGEVLRITVLSWR